jgi:hypothetical protein
LVFDDWDSERLPFGGVVARVFVCGAGDTYCLGGYERTGLLERPERGRAAMLSALVFPAQLLTAVLELLL